MQSVLLKRYFFDHPTDAKNKAAPVDTVLFIKSNQQKEKILKFCAELDNLLITRPTESSRPLSRYKIRFDPE